MGFLDKLFSPKQQDFVLGSPANGKAVPISEVSDPTFGEGILGQGVAIQPTSNRVCAPCDAVVEMMFDTAHAVSLKAENGAEILIHVGLETVSLKGEHFKALVKTGDHVTAGQPLIEYDRAALVEKGFDTIIPVVICNTDAFEHVTAQTGEVSEGEPLLKLGQKK